MYEEVWTAYKNTWLLAQDDPVCLALESRLRDAYAGYQAVFRTLARESQEALTEYLGICAERSNRLLELACFAQDDKL